MTQMESGSIHIVRRFGPVGGMEKYVFELTHALSTQVQNVLVLCEKNETENSDSAISVIVLDNRIKKPRWLAQSNFSRQVNQYLQTNPPHSSVIIHSHERTGNHHVTTFHGPPFENRKKRPFDFLSPRIHTWSKLEKRELMGPQVQAILPNSPLIADQLKSLYPAIADKILAPAYPGVSEKFTQIARHNNGKTLGFMGKEWRRKGLDLACIIFRQLRLAIPDAHFMVAGCEPEAVKHLFHDFPDESYTISGWCSPEDFLGKIDLLLHPARAEPFGMVVAEANAAGIPVVVSDQCGIAELISPHQGEVCMLDNENFDAGSWANACLNLLISPSEISPLNLSWDELAKQHIALYESIRKELTLTSK